MKAVAAEALDAPDNQQLRLQEGLPILETLTHQRIHQEGKPALERGLYSVSGIPAAPRRMHMTHPLVHSSESWEEQYEKDSPAQQ